MRVLLWHGYLLRGSGSNVYTANLARRWRAGGHDVLLMCQERDLSGLDFIDEHGDFAPDNASFETTSTGMSGAAARVTLVRPAIGKVLPVYVYDEYPGFTARRFVDLSDAELRDYTERNVSALVAAVEVFRPDGIVTGHEVMGPEIARRACERTSTRYIAKLHGSALEYAVKEQGRYREHAITGLGGADVVVGGSKYMVCEAARVIPGWLDRAAVVHPGCDVELFAPRERDRGAAPVAGFVGKLIAPKGVHHFLAALGLTTTPGLRAVVVGYGGFEDELHDLHAALARADIDEAHAIAEDGDGLPLTRLVRFLEEGPGAEYFRRAAEVEVEFTGRLEHGPLSELLPAFDVLVVPSILAEAFGMVAAEAAASGVLPAVARHSGIGEAGEILERELGAPGFLTFDPEEPIGEIARAIDRVLALPTEERRALEARAVAVARRRWSWDAVAARLLEFATTRR